MTRRRGGTAPGTIRHVYVHAPFCARRCVYCDFAVRVDRAPDSRRWLAAVQREAETIRASGDAPLASELDTLYVGGGTPSLLDPRLLGKLPRALGLSAKARPAQEWTAEANPESFSRSVAEEWASRGVNRISFGVQSFDPGALKWMGRLHSPEDAERAVAKARAAGVSNVSIDLIFGLPDAVSRSWEDDLRRALRLAPSHVSLYGLTVEKGTRLFRAIDAGRGSLPSETRYQEEYLIAAETLSSAGYDHYEVSSFALPGFASRHNRAYWSGASYLGLGNGAHSFAGGRRWWNHRDWETYLDRVARRGSGRAGQERLSPAQSRLESIWLALRTARGFRADAPGEPAVRLVRKWKRRGLAAADLPGTAGVRLTPRGWLVLDTLAVELEGAIIRR